jgi:hypothetical protein
MTSNLMRLQPALTQFLLHCLEDADASLPVRQAAVHSLELVIEKLGCSICCLNQVPSGQLRGGLLPALINMVWSRACLFVSTAPRVAVSKTAAVALDADKKLRHERDNVKRCVHQNMNTTVVCF